PDAPERVALEEIVRQPRPERGEAKRGQGRQKLSEEELLSQLASGEEVGLGEKAASALIEAYVKHVKYAADFTATRRAADRTPLPLRRPDLRSLPFRDGPASVLDPKSAAELHVLSRKLHVYFDALAPEGPDGRRESTAKLREQLRKDLRGKKPEWLRPEAVPTLNQMMMGEDAQMGRVLVELLTAIPGKKATAALASRAAFDLSADVRKEAVAALKGRDAEHWRPVLVNALRYPWPPPADFAAEALVGLEDKDAVPELVVLLKEPPA